MAETTTDRAIAESIVATLEQVANDGINSLNKIGNMILDQTGTVDEVLEELQCVLETLQTIRSHGALTTDLIQDVLGDTRGMAAKCDRVTHLLDTVKAENSDLQARNGDLERSLQVAHSKISSISYQLQRVADTSFEAGLNQGFTNAAIADGMSH